MPKPKEDTDEIVHGWIYQYARSLMWRYFKSYDKKSIADDEFIRGVLLKAEATDCRNLDILLTQWMFSVYNGQDISLDDGSDDITRLEVARSMLRHLKMKFTSLDPKMLIRVKRLLKEQAVLVCVKERSLARKVYDRLWNRCHNENDKDISHCLNTAIQRKSLSGLKLPSSFKDLMESAKELLNDLCEKQLPCPYLVELAEGQEPKQFGDTDTNGNSLSGRELKQTGIMLTGSLLTAFISKHGLVPKAGVGFTSQREFRAAVEAIRARRDVLLNQIPENLSIVVAAPANSSSASEPAQKTTSSSRRKRSYERRQDQDSDSDDMWDMSLRKRVSKNPRESLFGDLPQLSRPQPTAASRLRKPRAKWTALEEETLFKAVIKYGLRNWAEIITANVLPRRSNVDIKDKWRTMEKTGRVRELKAKFGDYFDPSADVTVF